MAILDQTFFDGYLAAWNQHDPAAVATYIAEGGVYEAVALGRVLRGPSEVASFVEEATRSSSDFRFEVVSLFTAGLPATGRTFRVRGASVGRVDAEGKILGNRDYYNLAEMLIQLGRFAAP